MGETATGKRGNPNYVKKTEENKKRTAPKTGLFVFKMTEDMSYLKPKDSKTGEIVDNPYPPIYIAPSSGIAFNEKSGETEPWRYLFGYNSIWEREQVSPEPPLRRINNVDGKNDLLFIKGYIKVKANDEAKFQALMVQDICADNDNKLNEVPVKYELIDESKIKLQARNDADQAYLAETKAREASIEEMLPIAMMFGIDIQNPEVNEENIRTSFIFNAKANPKVFLKNFADPNAKIKYAVTMGLLNGVISNNNGRLSFEETGEHILSVNPDSDVAAQVATKAMSGDEKAKKLYSLLKATDL